MAGWTNIPLTAGDDTWAATATWTELFGAWNERRAVLGQAAVTAPVQGGVINSHTLIEQMQDWVEVYCDDFRRTYDESGVRMTDLDAQPLLEWRAWSWTALAANVLPSGTGRPSNGWRRKKSTGVEAGKMAPSYYASYAELMNDLRLVFNELKWTSLGSTITGQYGEKKEGYYSDSSLATAKANAETEFAADTPIAYRSDMASYRVEIYSGYTASIERSTQKVKVFWTAPIVADIEWYVYAEALEGYGAVSEFDANGENYVEDELTLQSETDSTTVGTGDTTRVFGDTDLSLPTEPTAAPDSIRGYNGSSHLPLARWDTGFTYY
jgi:hypothetical protein